jgi:hypothetical protein
MKYMYIVYIPFYSTCKYNKQKCKTKKQNYNKLEIHGLRTRDTQKSGDRVENTEHTETVDISK